MTSHRYQEKHLDQAQKYLTEKDSKYHLKHKLKLIKRYFVNHEKIYEKSLSQIKLKILVSMDLKGYCIEEKSKLI